MRQRTAQPIHFGRCLEAFLEERGIGPSQLAGGSGITLAHVTVLITGEYILTADVALLLGEFFETSPLLWLELQRRCRREAREESESGVRREDDTFFQRYANSTRKMIYEGFVEHDSVIYYAVVPVVVEVRTRQAGFVSSGTPTVWLRITDA